MPFFQFFKGWLVYVDPLLDCCVHRVNIFHCHTYTITLPPPPPTSMHLHQLTQTKSKIMLYFRKLWGAFMPVLCIRIGYPDPALNLSADPDPDTGVRIHADRWSDFVVTKN